MIKITTLFSGSSGNSTLVRTDNTAVLIDCGKNCRAVCNALRQEGMELSDISAVFITHEHSDHISALDVMMRQRAIPIHVTAPSARELCRGRSAAENAVIHNALAFSVQVGDLRLESFPLPHDSAAHVGYVITDDTGDRAGVATDMGYVTVAAFEALRGCRQAVLEANHDVNMLKNGPYPYYLKNRILSRRGHLSNEDCGQLCLGLAESGTQAVMLAHLSHENNTPQTAYGAVSRALCDAGLCLCLKVADRSCATALLP